MSHKSWAARPLAKLEKGELSAFPTVKRKVSMLEGKSEAVHTSELHIAVVKPFEEVSDIDKLFSSSGT